MAKILIVEDDLTVSDTIKFWLRKEKHNVDSTASGREGLDLLLHYHYDLAILDWQLPDLAGVEIAKTIRAKNDDIPLLMLTSKSSLSERVTGLDAGAYDYVVKPCDLEELSARVRALLRRPADADDGASIYELGDLTFNLQSLEVRLGSENLNLSPAQFELLVFLSKNLATDFSGAILAVRVWPDKPSTKEVVRVHIRHLREKLQNSKVKILTSSAGEYSLQV